MEQKYERLPKIEKTESYLIDDTISVNVDEIFGADDEGLLRNSIFRFASGLKTVFKRSTIK